MKDQLVSGSHDRATMEPDDRRCFGRRTLTMGLPARAPGSSGEPQGERQKPEAAEAAPEPADPFWFAGAASAGESSTGAPVQRMLAEGSGAAAADREVHAAAARGVATPSSALPHGAVIQQAFGRHDISSIQAHVGADAGASARAMGARAYATGDHVVLDDAADLHTVAHEAAHVVQQRAGVHLKSVGSAGDVYEQHADRVADAVVAGRPAEALLDELAPTGGGSTGASVQRALVAAGGGGGIFVDNRQAGGGAQQFTPAGGALFTDGPGYTYRYTADEEFEVVAWPGGAPYTADRVWDVENQRELQRRTGVTATGTPLRIYTLPGNGVNPWGNRLYYTPGHLYRAVPTNRCRWQDDRGQLVEELYHHGVVSGHRVLTPDGARVDKQYAVGKEGRNFVVPYKQMGQPFLPGLPALFGGNVDPGEDAVTAVGREIGEESGNDVALGAMGGQLQQVNDGGNRYTISEAQVTSGHGVTAPPHEMSGTFQFSTSDFVGHSGSNLAAENQLLALFGNHLNTLGGGGAAHRHHLAHLGVGARGAWSGSHSTQALIAKIRQDTGDYVAGRDLARTGQVLPLLANAERQAGFNGYQAGVAAARSGQLAGVDSAEGTGHQDYTDGFADARQGANHHNHAGYADAQQDYADGLADAQQGANNHNHEAYTGAQQDYAGGLAAARAGQGAGADAANAAAHAEYLAGLQNMQAGNGALQNQTAYLQAQQDYNDGIADARGDQAAQQQYEARIAGHDDYVLGTNHSVAGIGQFALLLRPGYDAAFQDYQQGRQDALQHPPVPAAHATGAYARGYASVPQHGNHAMDDDNDVEMG